MRIISYALFKSACPTWVYHNYVRGLIFNTWMNHLLFPGWRTVANIDFETHEKFVEVLNAMQSLGKFTYLVNAESKLCESMLWRLKPCFNSHAEYVFCRDADAITTYREAQAIHEFIESGLDAHGITDNPAHTVPLMGGMCGFRAEAMRNEFGSYDLMLGQATNTIDKHGSDQVFLGCVVYPRMKKRMFGHFLQGKKFDYEHTVAAHIADIPIPGVPKKLWESNLICRHIGSPGIVEMEAIRFFERQGVDMTMNGVGYNYPKIFYWL